MSGLTGRVDAVRAWPAAVLLLMISVSPTYPEEKGQDDAKDVARAWQLISRAACDTGISADQSVDIPANTAVTISYTRLQPEASYIAVCYRSGEGSAWTFLSAFATEGGGNHGVITLGPYQNGFLILTNAVSNDGSGNVARMEKHKRSTTPYGIEFDYYPLSDSPAANTHIDLNMTPPPAR